jgi:uncharacterized YceG family protein
MIVRRTVGVVLALAVLGGIALGLWKLDRMLFGDDRALGPAVTVVIPEGAGVPAIASILAHANVIGSATDFELHELGQTGLRPGTYSIRRNEPYDRIVAILLAGPAARPTKRLVVPEGYAVRDIAAITPKVGLPSATFAKAASAAEPPQGFLAAGETAATIEGFLFPATYDVAQPPTGEELVAQELDAFSSSFARVDMAYPARKNLTRYDVLKIASLIEREAAAPEDRAKIAAVIYNRLHARMPLGIDATIQYAVGAWRVLTAADLRIDSPFNSRRVRGLPPTPICNPGLASLEAAARPARADYLYYVAIPGDPKRRHFFTSSYDAFLQFIKDHPS